MHGRGRYGSRGHRVIDARGGRSSSLPTDGGGSNGTWGEGLGVERGSGYSIYGDGVRVSGG
jgi:hypothetical protein